MMERLKKTAQQAVRVFGIYPNIFHIDFESTAEASRVMGFSNGIQIKRLCENGDTKLVHDPRPGCSGYIQVAFDYISAVGADR